MGSMIASEVLSTVRRIIGDTKGQTWSSSDLLDALNNARLELVRETGLLRASGNLYVIADKVIYDLPADCFLLRRAQVADATGTRDIDFNSMANLDELDRRWLNQETDDRLELLIKDNQSFNTVRTWPVLKAPNTEVTTTGTGGAITEFNGDNGGSLYGAITHLDTPGLNQTLNREDNFGVVTDFTGNFQKVKIFYIKKPVNLTAENQDTEMDIIYKLYLVYKTVEEILSYDNNAENIQKSVLFGQKAAGILGDILGNARDDFVRDEDIETQYNSVFSNRSSYIGDQDGNEFYDDF